MSNILGRVLGFMPLLRQMFSLIDDEINLINLMKYLNFQYRGFKCELGSSGYNISFLTDRSRFGVVNHILKRKIRNHGFVLDSMFSNSALGKKILKDGLVNK